ncbi:MAG TPA: protein kinase [Vicinamibacterales bacterium]|nr:protein kinase [Vicinamibacterales bacterium]
MALRAGDHLGPYRLESALGEGGIGEVWKAREMATGRSVALRFLPAPPPDEPHRFARFERDVRILSSLNHPNIARIHRLIDVDRVRALASEWVDAPSLAERLSRGAILIKETLPIVAQIANAIGAAHARDVVHGNLKPANIKLRPDGTVKVLDLGIVEVFEPEGAPSRAETIPSASARLLSVVTGTAAYVSPEQVRGAHADSRTDVWAFGCVLFEMLTGKPAFGAADLAETMDLVSSSEPEWTLLPPAMPSSLDRVVRCCLAKDAALRFQRLTDVLAPIREAIGEQGAVEAFLRQSPLRRMSHVRVEPRWTTDIWPEIEKELPALKRWASSRLPRDFEIDVEDLVHDVAIYVIGRLEYLGPDHRGAIAAFLRQAVALRILDIRRAHSRQF